MPYLLPSWHVFYNFKHNGSYLLLSCITAWLHILQITLKASDNGRPSLSAVIPFRVELMDIDDNDPYFPLYPRVTTLEVEEEKINAYVGRVNISDDKDFLPENRIMCYYLYGNWPQR